MAEVYDTTDETFEEDVLARPLPVLVDFWATWCGPCKALAPVLHRVAQKYDGRLLVVKLDVDRNPDARRRYNVRSVPRMILFKDGREVAALLGAHPVQRIEQMIDPHVEAPPVHSMPTASVLPAESFAPQPSFSTADPLEDLIQPAGRRR